MKYGEFPSRQAVEKLAGHVFVRDGVDKSIFDFIENTKAIYNFVESQLKKFADLYCNPNEDGTNRFAYKSEEDKEKFVASVRKLMDSDIKEDVPMLDITRDDLSSGAFFRSSDPKTWIGASDMSLIFKFVDATQKESCE